ncbi:hypothetical protein STRAU_3756 [Streptomyces aurantiacus JA 4570]|uniref:Uncharacterized protein n=1 Tax=Streptomyces aurantiacus JA 4570 TaxID=1286094 RepID=S3ZHY3_9ACTN|nr:hypothetical protein [Streptomyces aurantiacus]EPH43226.1 hypothetical protein STRAU_3756 [Streptomyces aurantiacus JA 4570]
MQHDAVAGREPGIDQARRDPVGALVEFGEGPAGVGGPGVGGPGVGVARVSVARVSVARMPLPTTAVRSAYAAASEVSSAPKVCPRQWPAAR